MKRHVDVYGKKSRKNGQNSDSYSIFGGNGVVDLFKEYRFEIKALLTVSDHFQNCFAFGVLLHGMVKNFNVSDIPMRSWFNSQKPICRISFLLADCTAHISDVDMTILQQQFENTVIIVHHEKQTLNVITTGSLRAILMGFAKNLTKKVNGFEKIVNQTKVESQDIAYEDYAQFAVMLLEIFVYNNVRITYNETVKYGLASKMIENVTFGKQLLEPFPICCSINLKTNATATKLVMKDKVRNKQTNKTEIITTDYGTGVFGIPYYINSAKNDTGKKVGTQNVNIYVRNDVKLALYRSENNTYNYSYVVQVSIVNIKQFCSIDFGDALLWQYEYDCYKKQGRRSLEEGGAKNGQSSVKKQRMCDV
jgi:hypothetical protein